MFASRTSASALICLFATGCVTAPPNERIAQNAVSAIPKASKVEANTNDLTEVLSCVGAQVAAYGTKPFYVGNDRIVNETGVKEGIPESARTMLQSAFATLVEQSNGKVVWSGWSTSVDNELVRSTLKENRALATGGDNSQNQPQPLGKREYTFDTPQYFIVGSISQFEKDLQRAARDGNAKGKTAELANSEVASLSLLATSMTLMRLTSDNMAMHKGIQSSNVLKVTTEEDSSSLFGGIASIAGISLNVAIQKKEPVSGALMQLMQAGAIEITGKFYQDDFDYRGCLHKESRRQILGKLTGNNASNEEQSKESLLIHAVNARLPQPSMILFAKGTYNHGDKVVVDAQGRDNGYLNCFYSS